MPITKDNYMYIEWTCDGCDGKFKRDEWHENGCWPWLSLGGLTYCEECGKASLWRTVQSLGNVAIREAAIKYMEVQERLEREREAEKLRAEILNAQERLSQLETNQ